MVDEVSPPAALDSPSVMSATATLFVVVLAGIATVVASILVWKLHAFLALVLGALVVGLLTPAAAIENHFVETKAARVVAVDGAGITLERSPAAYPEGSQWLVLRRSDQDGRYATIATASSRPAGKQVLVAFNAAYSPDSRRSGDLLVAPADLAAARKSATENLGSRLAMAFGSMAGQIGILIALASVIGKCLLDSGAADRIVRTMLRWFGERGAPLAFILSGFLLAIPVFFDTVFYLMIPLGKAMGLRTGKHYLLYVLTIVAGGTMAHSLVPPTPGPLLVAAELKVDLGTMILAGCGVGLASSLAGLFWAYRVNARDELPLRDTPDLAISDLRKITERDEKSLPSFTLSLLPILLPVLLIGGFAVLEQKMDDPVSGDKVTLLSRLPELAQEILKLLGDKNIAIGIGAVIAIFVLLRQTRPSREEFAASVQSSLAGAGVIILITSAGGAFGQMLKETGVASLIRDLPGQAPLMLLLLAFLVTAAIRTAQGSSTVAMITAVGLFGPLAESGSLGLHPVYLALAIGCGSKPIAWMNDSGFWVITRMSGMTEREGLKYIAPMSILMGVSGMVVTLIAAAIWPGV